MSKSTSTIALSLMKLCRTMHESIILVFFSPDKMVGLTKSSTSSLEHQMHVR
uniref:Uncharacterized protein n=1 Tax=Arundo donax TaxID=35708 RepID=A0A0A9EPV4_ARUDO